MSERLFEVTTEEMLACAVRELKLRRRVYPRRVAAKQMTQHKADHELTVQEAIIRHFQAITEDKPHGDRR